MPVYKFEFNIKTDNLQLYNIQFKADHTNIIIQRFILLGPNGRVIKYSMKHTDTFDFYTKLTGKYVIKYWMDYPQIPQMYYVNLYLKPTPIDNKIEIEYPLINNTKSHNTENNINIIKEDISIDI